MTKLRLGRLRNRGWISETESSIVCPKHQWEALNPTHSSDHWFLAPRHKTDYKIPSSAAVSKTRPALPRLIGHILRLFITKLWVSSVSTATATSWDCPGIECRWGRDFSVLGPSQPLIKWVPCHYGGGGYSGRDVVLTFYFHLAPKLKKERSSTSAPHLCLHGTF